MTLCPLELLQVNACVVLKDTCVFVRLYHATDVFVTKTLLAHTVNYNTLLYCDVVINLKCTVVHFSALCFEVLNWVTVVSTVVKVLLHVRHCCENLLELLVSNLLTYFVCISCESVVVLREVTLNFITQLSAECSKHRSISCFLSNRLCCWLRYRLIDGLFDFVLNLRGVFCGNFESGLICLYFRSFSYWLSGLSSFFCLGLLRLRSRSAVIIQPIDGT